jgi:hypothetical protein
MFIESATAKNLSSLQRSETWFGYHVLTTETLRTVGARVIELEALSINISLAWSEN